MRSSAAVGMAVLGLAATDAFANSPPDRRFLFFTGTDLSSISAFSWAGVEAPLFRSDGSGPIVRLMGGMGRYDYARDGAPDGKVIGDVMLGEVMAGWRHIGGALCVSVLGGFAVEDHELDVPDPVNEVQGTETGVKIAAELFWRPTGKIQVEASVAYAATFDFWRARLAAGHAVRGLVIGPEAEAFGNSGSDQIRLGVFVSDIDWRRFSFKASVGALHDGENTGAYGRFGMDARF